MDQRTVRHGGLKITAIARDIRDGRSYGSKTRVYGAIDALSLELVGELDKWTATSVTEQFQREHPDEARRIMRGYRKARRAVVTDARRKLNELFADVRVMTTFDGHVGEVSHFSVKAGCSCSCSPGFVLRRTVHVDHRPVDLWIETDEEGE
jgi:hypothetical protein